MNWRDNWHFSYQALVRYPMRTALLVIAVAIGVASVLVLTSIGEGARHFIEKEFSALGTDILIVLPGKKETVGASPPIYGTSPRDLTIDDAYALNRVATVTSVAPVIAGTALISSGSLAREVITLGTNNAFFDIRQLVLEQGKRLPANSIERASQVCVLGSKLKQELFGSSNALGEWLRFGDSRYRVIGVLAERGESLGLDMRDMAFIPIRSAESLFNSPGIFRILLQLSSQDAIEHSQDKIREIIKQRHEGEDDVTFISQNSVMSAFNNIISGVTIAIACIGSISLIVAGFLIMNVSYVSVSRRRSEIGLLKALGANAKTILILFLSESVLLVSAGYVVGLVIGYGVSSLANYLFPDFTLIIPVWALIAAAVVTIGIGILFSWLPSSRAARQDPVKALHGS